MLVHLRIIWLVKSDLFQALPLGAHTTNLEISLLCLHAARPESWVAKITYVEVEVKSCC